MSYHCFGVRYSGLATWKFFFAAFVGCSLMVASPAGCQTYEETQEFVVRKFPHAWDNDPHRVISVAFAERCRAIFDRITYYSSGTHHIQHEINFRDIDPSRIKWVYSPDSYTSWIEIQTTDDQDKIRFVYVSGTTAPDGSSSLGNSTRLEFPDDDRVGQQLERALRHLTELCGGKAELF